MCYQLYGLVALLLAKGLGHTPQSLDFEDSLKHEGITSKQRKLADALELYRSACVIHNNILNLSKEKDGEISLSLLKANSIGVLVGDYLAANAAVVLGGIRDNKVLGIVTDGFIDFTQSAFLGESDNNGNSLPDALSPLSIWQQKLFTSHASLLAKGCQAIAYLGGHKDDVQMKAYNFAKNMALAVQINKDLHLFNEIFDFRPGMPFSLDLTPVIMHLDEDRELVKYAIENGAQDINNLDFERVLIAVKTGQGVKKATALLESHISNGLEAIHSMGCDSKAAQNLLKMLEALRMD